MIGVGVIGYGYWGPNLARNFAESKDCALVAVSDTKAELAGQASRRYPGIAVTPDHDALIRNPDVDAVVIATPVAAHFALAMAALRAGKHVLVTKPLASTSAQCARLIDEAAKRKLVLMVDHTFVYTGAVRKIKELIAKREFGDAYYYDSVRVNLGLFQKDVDVIWDLAVHDLSIMDYVLGRRPRAVSATGIAHVPGGQNNTAYMTLFFDKNLIGHIHANWLSPVKVRRTLIGGSKQMIVYDDLEPSEKVKIYDKGITIGVDKENAYKQLVSYRTGDMRAPRLDIAEALNIEVAHFADCVTRSRRPITGGEAGLTTVRVLEAATKSMVRRGHPVDIAS